MYPDASKRLPMIGGRSARTALLVLGVAAAGCAAHVAPMTEAGQGYAEPEDEAWLIAQANLVVADIDQRGGEFDECGAQAYVSEVGARLAPPHLPANFAFHYHVLRSPTVNAFALPQGDVYVPVGLLAELDNEAELAQVLAHEMTHVVARHGIEALRSRRRKAVAAQVAGMATLGIGTAFANAPYLLSVTSYMREQEEEADRQAVEMVGRAGYDPAAAAALYDTIASAIPPAAKGGESIYSTHPSLTERSAYVHALAAASTGSAGRVETERYQTLVGCLDRELVRLLLQDEQYAAAQQHAARVLAAQPEAAWAHCAVAAAHQGAADDPVGAARERAVREGRDKLSDDLVSVAEQAAASEREQALASYRRCLELDANAAAAYRGLGLLARTQGDPAAARRNLARYLEVAPAAPDRRYIATLLEQPTP